MLHAVILAGGSGTRFWPASRQALPKQLLPLGSSAQPLIAATVRRIAPLCSPERVLVATGQHLLEQTRSALPGLPASAFLGEPIARNTAPCLTWAAGVLARRDPDAVVMVLPSDHEVTDEAAFLAALGRAVTAAEGGAIATVGITPTRPETGFGYIELGPRLAEGVHRGLRFVEKPALALAQEYVESGRFVWNAGMFFFRARTLLAAVEAHLPELHAALAELPAEASEAEARAAFARAPAVSIDTGVMEKLAEFQVVPAEFGWSDLGSWESAWELAPRDVAGNAAPEHAVLVDATNNLVRDLRTDGRPRVVALVGVSDLCVVETDDALLVLPRSQAQDVRLVVQALERAGRKVHL